MIMVQERPRPTLAASDRGVLERSIRAGVERCHPTMDADSVLIRTIREEHRPNASLYELDLDDGGATMSLLIKVPVAAPAGARTGEASRPRLVDQPDAMLSRRLEHAALAAIHEHFAELADPRFGAIRVFEGVAPEGALVMERLHQPSLRALLMREQRWRRGGADERLVRAFANAGAWLRSYHGMEPGEHAVARHTRRSELVATCEAIAAWVGARTGAEAFLRSTADEIRAAAERVLPDTLPLGLSHGDFALRNVLVADDERVTVCDTRSRWVTAIYEDLGYFLASLRWNWPQLYSFDFAFDPGLLERCERDFLCGYFAAAEPPAEEVRIYRLLALLDRLAGEVSQETGPGGWVATTRQKVKIALLLRALRGEMRGIHRMADPRDGQARARR